MEPNPERIDTSYGRLEALDRPRIYLYNRVIHTLRFGRQHIEFDEFPRPQPGQLLPFHIGVFLCGIQLLEIPIAVPLQDPVVPLQEHRDPARSGDISRARLRQYQQDAPHSRERPDAMLLPRTQPCRLVPLTYRAPLPPPPAGPVPSTLSPYVPADGRPQRPDKGLETRVSSSRPPLWEPQNMPESIANASLGPAKPGSAAGSTSTGRGEWLGSYQIYIITIITIITIIAIITY